ncbi:MAG: hypothetical protein FWE22_00405 [Firmicutes bacterium]|nr:hypothetical protein [Bacillota bacterium]
MKRVFDPLDGECLSSIFDTFVSLCLTYDQPNKGIEDACQVFSILLNDFVCPNFPIQNSRRLLISGFDPVVGEFNVIAISHKTIEDS